MGVWCVGDTLAKVLVWDLAGGLLQEERTAEHRYRKKQHKPKFQGRDFAQGLCGGVECMLLETDYLGLNPDCDTTVDLSKHLK